MNGKVTENLTTNTTGEGKDIKGNNYKTSELELLSNLCLCTETDQDIKEITLLISKRLAKTNPINRLNIPAPSDTRKYR